jgi:hypothetical protein
MLDVDEHRLAVRRPGDAGDFAARGADQEALDGLGLRIGRQHLVVAHAREVAAVGE